MLCLVTFLAATRLKSKVFSLAEKNFGSENFFLGLTKNFDLKINFGSEKNVRSEKNMNSKFFRGPIKFLV